VQDIIRRLKAKGSLTPDQLVDSCLDLMGPMEVGNETRQELLEQAQSSGNLSWDDDNAEQRVMEILQLIVAMREYQFN